jgi:hypothetical protein
MQSDTERESASLKGGGREGAGRCALLFVVDALASDSAVAALQDFDYALQHVANLARHLMQPWVWHRRH